MYNTDQDAWKKIQKNGMAANFSWQHSADEYARLYEWAQKRVGR
jgi:glycogen synthase